ncbi:MAG: hypothetical protein KKI08_23600 [Armatimonadetes bacterium]|nr:hypothetical protein [Armatimonadota bacterium]
MGELLEVWAQLTPQARSFVGFTVAGVLGALATVALERRPVVPPRVRRGSLHLGFIGTLIISLVAAHAVDHTFSAALIAAVCGGATLRRLKAQIDRGFEREHERLDGEGDDG